MGNSFKRVVSHSQLSMYEACPLRWKLRYVDKHKDDTPSIWATLGTVLHEVAQEFLLGKLTKPQIMDAIKHGVVKESKITDKETGEITGWRHTRDEMKEMIGMGLTLTLTEDFSSPGPTFKLVDAEYKLESRVVDEWDVYMVGYIDLLWYDEADNLYIISDLKFTNKGWSKWTKADELKTNQVNLYRYYLAEKKDVHLRDIKTRYEIYRFNVPDWSWDEAKHHTYKPNQSFKAAKGIAEQMKQFVTAAFNKDGSFNTDREWQANKKACKFCPFKERYDLCPSENRQ